MIRFIRALPYLFLFSLTVVLSAADFSFSSDRLLTILESSLLSETTVSFDGEFLRAVSLLEALPLMEEVYDLEIHGPDGKRFRDDDLAEYWAESFFLRHNGNLDFLFQGVLYRNITELRYSGTEMETRELEVWLSWEGVDELKGELHRFSRIHRLDIHAVEVPSPDSKLVSVVRARGDIPDLVMIQSSAVDKLVRNRAVQSLDYLRLPELNSSGLDAFTLDGSLRAVPFYSDTQIFLCNPELVDLTSSVSGGIRTLSDLEKLARTVDGIDKYPMAWNAYSSNWLIPFQVSFGKNNLLNPDGSITVDDNPTKRALEYIISLQDEGLLEPLERDAMDALFISGRIGIIMTGSYSIPYFESLGIPFSVLSVPLNQRTGISLSPLLDYKGFCITRQSSAPILARRIIQYLSGSGVQQRYCMALTKLPARTRVLDFMGIGLNHLEILKDASDTGTVIPPQKVYSIYKNNMWKLLRFALSGRMSVSQTLEQGQRLLDNSVEN